MGEIVRLFALDDNSGVISNGVTRYLYDRIDEPADPDAADLVIRGLEPQIIGDVAVAGIAGFGGRLAKHFRPNGIEFRHKARIGRLRRKGNFVVLFCKRFFLPAKHAKGREKMTEILFREESYKIIGACFEVYKAKGCGFNEFFYQECLQIEFELQDIPFVSQPTLEMEYKGTQLKQFFKPDFICFGKIILEIKAIERLADAHRAQCLNYLSATGYDLAIIANFGHFPKLEYERIANTINRGTRPSIYSRLANHLEIEK